MKIVNAKTVIPLRFGVLAVVWALAAQSVQAQDAPMTFFITSVGPGDGANLGGLEGADAHCRNLAEAVGAGEAVWRAYLSALPREEAEAVHARDRIGAGPWHNHSGVEIARNAEHLHSEEANLTKETILTENGDMVNGRGDSPNMHDIVTGSTLDGLAYLGGDNDAYDNCGNWTDNGDGSTRVGHHDRTGGGENPTSWNSAHSSRGCSQANLRATGGNGLYYCFAAEGGASRPGLYDLLVEEGSVAATKGR